MPATLEELWSLVEKLPRKDRVRLARLALARTELPASASDAARYAKTPPSEGEFGDEDWDPMAWDAEGWDEFA